jgi:Flp pilus assembly protein TadB
VNIVDIHVQLLFCVSLVAITVLGTLTGVAILSWDRADLAFLFMGIASAIVSIFFLVTGSAGSLFFYAAVAITCFVLFSKERKKRMKKLAG